MSIVKVVGYVRCSTQEQATDGWSLEAQESRIRAWCDATGASLKAILSDEGVSGSRPLSDRPGGAEIARILDARQPYAEAVVVVRLDRLGRDAAETLMYLRRFAQGRVGLVSITERIDLSTPQGRAMAGMAAVFAELERGLIAQRTSDALRELRSQRRVYGPVPFGFDARDGLLVESPEEQQVIQRLRRMRQRGLSYQRCADLLNRDGVQPKRGSRWYGMSVRSVLATQAELPAAA